MTTYIMFVLDETGSMDSVRKDTIGSFNNYIGDLKKELDNTVFSLLKFNSENMDWVHDGVSLNVVDEMTEEDYNPNHVTPLWDAFGVALKKMEDLTKHAGSEDKVIVSVLTDGLENASKEYTPEQVRKMVEQHDGWAITFLGANMDAWGDVGSTVGLSVGSTMTYDQGDMSGTMHAHSRSTVAFAKGQTQVDNFYSGVDEEEKTHDSDV